jgi:hypothetical protein
MTEMTEKEGKGAKIRKGLSARRDPISYRVEQDIVIPAGTMLRSIGGDKFAAQVGPIGQFSISPKPGEIPLPEQYRKVISS